MTANMQSRLEKLISDVEKAEEAVKAGKRVDMRAMDSESLAIHKILKTKPDASLQPVLMRAITALERLTSTLESHVDTLKANRK
ncbi:MAG: hypothetical protein KGQ41_01310 [Alphaproteobacteria bacterium]|nr:hypothetical protein [Alphaproteobacteria bacterium]